MLTVEFVVKEAASSWTGEAGVMPGVHRCVDITTVSTVPTNNIYNMTTGHLRPPRTRTPPSTRRRSTPGRTAHSQVTRGTHHVISSFLF